MSQFNPDAFTLSKAELTGKMDLFHARVSRNPNVNGKVKKYVGINLALLKSRLVSEKDMKYALQLLCEFCDDIRAINVRRQSKELAELNPLFEKEIEKKIALTPEERTTESRKVIVDFTRAMFAKGALKDA